MRYQSKWYLKERREHARQMAQPMRSTAKPGREADGKAIEYALWLLKRDGLDVDMMAEAVRAEHNAKFPPSKHGSGKRVWWTDHPQAIPARLEWRAVVEWSYCQFGRRPRFVHIEFSEAPTRYTKGRQYAPIHSVELPHWAAEIDGEIEEITSAEDYANA